MKFSKVAILSALSLGSGAAARSSRFRVQDDDNEPIEERSHVTAFVKTDEGLKVQCWEIGDYLPEAKHAKGSVRAVSLSNRADVTLYSFDPSSTIISTDHTGNLKTSAVDFNSGGNLFTIKDGLVIINTSGEHYDNVRASDTDNQYVFADINGDDWFYFEDNPAPGGIINDNDGDKVANCEKSHSKNQVAESKLVAIAASGSHTSLINFAYKSTPKHKVLHEGRCNFAGLASGDNSNED